MKKYTIILLSLVLLLILTQLVVQADTSQEDACWGQATAVFASSGDMGEHASSQPTPRIGLYNLAVALYDAGAITEPSIQALGVFVATESGLSISACM